MDNKTSSRKELERDNQLEKYEVYFVCSEELLLSDWHTYAIIGQDTWDRLAVQDNHGYLIQQFSFRSLPVNAQVEGISNERCNRNRIGSQFYM